MRASELCVDNLGAQNSPPVDLVYLSSLSMGDQSLEKELLGMFAAQLPNYLQSLRNSRTADEKFRALHTLKGAARSVGALDLSHIAGDMEKDCSITNDRLLKETARVAEYISQIAE